MWWSPTVADIHVLATFESQTALLFGMRGASSWVKISEADAIIALVREDSLKAALVPDDYSDREVELAIEVFRYYAEKALFRGSDG
jgi:hypothetical protein